MLLLLWLYVIYGTVRFMLVPPFVYGKLTVYDRNTNVGF